MQLQKTQELFNQALKYTPGGVNSPVRAFKSIGCDPIFMERGEGSHIFDVDGNEYIDYVGSWGPLIVGHAHPKVVEAIREAASRGSSFGTPTREETAMVQEVQKAFPHLEKLRLVSSGTEATMSAIRLARGATGRDKVLKFEGCYHGHVDSLLVKAGSGAATFGVPTSPGVPADFAKHTLTATYNDLEGVKTLVEQHSGDIACIILEAVAGNIGCVPPKEGFLQGLRQLCDAHGILLIIDEVMTGFRVAFGGAQERYGVKADITCLGKVIGGGMPVGAFGASAKLMDQLSPVGGIYQAGTLSGNPLAMAAGLATLQLLQEEGVYEQLEEKSAYLEHGLRHALISNDITACPQRVGAMFCTYFTQGPVENFDHVSRSDLERFNRFYLAMLEQGIYLAPSQFEAGFMSTAHTQEDLDKTIEAAHKACQALAAE